MKNRYTVLGKTAHKTHETERSLGSSFGKVGKSLALITFFLLSLLSGQVKAQVSGYSFAQSAGTYTAITGGTTLFSAQDDNVGTVTIPFSFVYNGASYTSCTVNSNGYIVFGAAGLTANYTPISSITGVGVVSVFGRDLVSTVSYVTTGVAPNRKFTIQYVANRYTYTETLNFQIVLSETSNTVSCIYGGVTTTSTVNDNAIQIGLRGSATTDYNNRSLAAAANWNTAVAGTANTAYVRFRNTAAPTSGLTWVWTPPTPPACSAPSALTSSAITSTSATISWTAPASAPASGYQYYVSTVNTAPTGATVPTGSTAAGVTSASLTGLTANTTYYFWVRSNCGGSGTSTWTGSSSFFTGYCTPTYATGGTTDYITQVTLPAFNGTLSQATASNVSPYYVNYTGSQNILPQLYTSSNYSLSLTFSTDGNQYNGVWIDFNQNLVFETSEFFTSNTNAGASGTVTVTIAVPAGALAGTTRMRIRGGEDSQLTNAQACGASSSAYGQAQDYSVSIVIAPACTGTPSPGSTLTSSSSVGSGQTVSLSLSTPPVGTGLTYQWQSAPTSTGTWTNISGATASTYTATVTANAWYRCVVTCSGVNGTSTPVQVTLTYCTPPASTYACGTLNYVSFSTAGGVTNINNPTACTGQYTNYSSTLSASQYATGSLTCNFGATGSGTAYVVFVDWNNDLDFADAGETVLTIANSAGSAAAQSGAFTVPVGTPLGNYRMRVRGQYYFTGTPTDPCNGLSWGETEDYTLSVVAPPTCVAPTSLVSSSITSTSATISWTAPASAPGSGYNYYVSTTNTAPTGSTTPTGSTAAGVTSASITGLTANTTYYYWVQSNCGGGNGTSAWAGSSSFFTGYCTPVATATSTYFSNFVTTGGVSNISNNSAAISAGGYGNFTAQSASQYPGSTVGFQATIVGGTAGIAVFIDWNNDLDFADAGETMYSSNAYQATGTTTSSFVIPAAAALGNYRMRIVTDYNAINPTPCSFAFGAGEAEDYTISVIALPLCSGTPAPGSTIASQTAFCSGTGTVNLSISTAFTASGISYQWQSSTDGVSFSNVSGATSATYTTPTLSSTTYYQCVVTCSAGGSANSTPVAILFGSPSAPTATNSVSCGPGVPTGTVASTSGLTNPNLTWYTAATGGNVVLTSYTGALTSYYSNNFSSNTGIGALTGNASLTGGVVQLTPNLGSQLGALTIPASGVSADKYNVSFNLITSNVAQSGADGLSYSFGDDVSGTSTTLAAETGSGTKLMVSFDDYGTSGGGVSGIRVIYGSTISDPGTAVGTNGILAYNSTTSWASVNGNVPVVIDINNLGQLTLTVNGTAIFSNLQLPAAYLNANKATWKHGFKARTGGVSMIHSIDNVNIQQSSYVAATSYPNNVLATTTYYVTEANSVGCQSTATPITFTVNAAPAMTISAATATVCTGSPSSLVTLTSPAANYDTYTWTPSATVSGSSAAGWNFAPTANTTYTLTGTNATTQCSNIANITVSVNTLPSALTVTPSAATMCVGNIQNLVATGGTMNATMFSEDFNGGVSSWTITNAGTSPAVSNWTSQTAPYTDATGSATFSNFSTANGGKFAYSNPDAGGSGSTTNSVLMSPSFSTVNATNATLTFEHVYYKWTSGDATVALEISSDNGATWTVLKDYKTLGSQGTTTSNAQVTTNESIVLGAAYLNKPNVKIRFNYVSTWGYFWIIDNIKVMGNQTVNVTWAGADAFSNATATTAYVAGTNTTSIYAKPSATTTYTATATSAAGCTSSATATLTLPTAGSALAQNNENATCTVNQNGWVHFYHSSGRLIGSINSQGQNLGNVTVTSYVDGTNALVPACTNSNPIYSTSVMQRHWVITPTTQPTTPVLVRFPYSNAEFSGLTSAASTNANSNDDLLTPADLGMTKYSNGTAANVNSDPLDNCGVGTATFHTQLGTGLATSYSGVSANYVDFQIPGFSEFWLHGSSQASPLPVELVSFQANCAGEGKVNVTWATASEHNSANFTVEKSRDGFNWTVLSSVAGAGNSTQMINYSVMDNNAAAGVNYYRLTQTDFDGASETFNIASANCGDNSPLTTVKVYPNPSAGDFYIDFTSEEITGSSVITITDARGMEVYNMNVTVEKGSNVFHIENMEAAPGMYYIQVSNGTNTSNIVKHSLR